MHVKKWVLLGVVALNAMSGSLNAEPISDFRETILTSVLNNPRVNASWYTFLEAGQERRVASGRYFPRVDLIGEYGHESRDDPLRTRAGLDSYTHDSTRLALTQMLFDGFETKYEVERLGYNRLARYHELKAVSEQTALEASQAYFDVLRYQQLVSLAEDNYVQHKLIYDNIQERVSAGIGRRVDLEQASGRLALAESNLLTETTNLHDVTARYLRVVGQPPAEQLSPPTLPTTMIPDDKVETLTQAYSQSPELAAATESLLAAQSELKAKKSPMYPRLDLRFREELEHDTNGVLGNYEERAVELVMTYNLYNGGSDRARKRQFYQRLNSARERREQACRDVRQTITIAYNDIQSLTQQQVFLDRNRKAISKARLAYRKQFDIGQRTLLDLLDTENEYFEVQRSYVNAGYDLLGAQTRTLATMGSLLAALDVDGLESKAEKQIDWQANNTEQDLMSCPPEISPTRVLNKQAILDKAMADKRLRQLSHNKVSFSMDVKFDYASANIQSGFSKDIDDAVNMLKKFPKVTGVIEGHADYVGSDSFNLKLSQDRANAVMQAMINLGIAADRLKAIGYGESRPVSDNTTESGRAQNRRVALVMQAMEPSKPLKLADFANIPE